MPVSEYEIQTFPSDFTKAYTAGRDVVSIVTAGETTTKRSQLALAVLNVAGFAGGQVLGQPRVIAGGSIDEDRCPAEQLAEELRPMVAASAGGLEVGLKINWLKILSLALKLLPLLVAEKE